MDGVHWKKKFLEGKPEGSYLTTRQIADKTGVSCRHIERIRANPANQFPKPATIKGVFYYAAAEIEEWLKTHNPKTMPGRIKPERQTAPGSWKTRSNYSSVTPTEEAKSLAVQKGGQHFENSISPRQ